MTENPKRSEILLLIASTLITLVIALLAIRWLQPSLLNIPGDMIVVQSDKEIPPYYERIFSSADLKSGDYLLPDPYVQLRAKQLIPDLGYYGPHDLLGFRNTSVPNTADVIIIGDSQTYGNNVNIWNNWPHLLQQSLPQGVSVYSMATGAWGAVQYFYAFAKSLAFSPEVVLIAYYMGNDEADTFNLIYGSDIWKKLILDKSLTAKDHPQSAFPPPRIEQWPVRFSDGVKTIFTPKHRHASIQKHPAVNAGFNIMLALADEIANKAAMEKIKIIFTIIPTKEYVYLEKIRQDRIKQTPEYEILVTDEEFRIIGFSKALAAIDNAIYVDLSKPLQRAALEPVPLYPEDINGHPLIAGYKVIADTLRSAILQHTTPVVNGYAIATTHNGTVSLVYVHDGSFWLVDTPQSMETVQKSMGDLPGYNTRKLEDMKYMGHITMDEIKNLSGTLN